jgi:glyoxylate reductase
MSRVFVTRRLPGDAIERLAREHEVRVHEGEGPIAHDALVAAAETADAIVTTLVDRVDAAVLRPGLKVVANYAVGYDNIDLEAARAAGVVVCNTPDVLTDATADLAFALLLGAARRLGEAERLVRAGRWGAWRPDLLLGRAVAGARLGVVGAGRIGRAVLARGRGFGMRLAYTSRRPKPPEVVFGAEQMSLDRLLAECDFVSLHVPLTPETHHLLDRERLFSMKEGAVLVNTARGPVVDEAALAEALEEGPLFAAGLDVFEAEPKVHPTLLEREDVLLSPHLGSATVQARARMAKLCADAVRAVLAGEEPEHRVV